MAVVRTTYATVSASTVIGAGLSATIDLPRPADTVETNTIDFVARPAFRKEFESGRCIVTPDANIGASGAALLVAVYIMALNPGNSLAPIDLSFSQFPSPPVAGQATLLRTVMDLTASPSTSPYKMDIPAAGLSNPTLDLLKSLLVRTGEFVRVILYSTGGVTGVLEARYDFGQNAANLPSTV